MRIEKEKQRMIELEVGDGEERELGVLEDREWGKEVIQLELDIAHSKVKDTKIIFASKKKAQKAQMKSVNLINIHK